jgi:hypothetical protein
MSDWGDYTPGRWFWPYGNTLAGNLGPGEDPDAVSWWLVAGFARDVGPKEADARLISKAYLIPRLEVWIAELLADGGVYRSDVIDAGHALLAELRKP